MNLTLTQEKSAHQSGDLIRIFSHQGGNVSCIGISVTISSPGEELDL